jgi:small subunit ribosomal protein S18
MESNIKKDKDNESSVQESPKPEKPFIRKPHQKRRKQCAFCVDRAKKIDYKESLRLRRYISERAKILPRRATGMCAKHQRVLALAIKRARILALLPCINS